MKIYHLKLFLWYLLELFCDNTQMVTDLISNIYGKSTHQEKYHSLHFELWITYFIKKLIQKQNH